METLKIEHLVIAIQHRQKIQYFDDERELNQICEIVELRPEEMTISNNEYQYDVEFDDVKPILFPLSSLTKEIEINGEKFVPYKKLGWELINGDSEFGQVVYCEYGESPKTAVNVLDYLDDLQKLQEWKFDIYGLIEKGLAIAVTDEFNPYKQ
jgi:hypothetical protein